MSREGSGEDAEVFERVTTGMPGLDRILDGGWPEHGVYLVRGGSGTGKTTMGLHFLLEGKARGEQGLYISLSQSTRMLTRIADSHGWSLDGIAVHAITPQEILRQLRSKQDVFVSDEVELIDVAERVQQLVEEIRPQRLVFDSLNFVEMLATTPGRFEQELAALVEMLGDREVTALFVQSADESSSADMILDGVVALQHLALDFAGKRYRLVVEKLRGSDYRGGQHDFEIVHQGVLVYPRLAFSKTGVPRREQQVPEPKDHLSGIEELDRMAGGGLRSGSSCLVLGTSGSGKSTFATRYVWAAAERGSRCVYFLLEEGTGTFLRRSKALHMDLEPHIEADRVRLHQLSGASILPGELAALIRESMEWGAEIVVLDSLSGYYQSLPEEQLVLSQIRDLIRYLEQRGVLSFLTLSQWSLTRGPSEVPLDVSESVDVIVNLQYHGRREDLRKGITIVKRRDVMHDTSMREFVISSERGVGIGERFRHFGAWQTGGETVAAEGQGGGDEE